MYSGNGSDIKSCMSSDIVLTDVLPCISFDMWSDNGESGTSVGNVP